MKRIIYTVSVLGFGILCSAILLAGATGVVLAQSPAAQPSVTPGSVHAELGGKVATGNLVLLKKEQLDVNDDGVLDTVAYFDSDGDTVVDGEAIDIGSTGHVSVLAIRADADNDGRSDDWLVVNADTEEVRAALIDGDNDGQADSISYADGKSTPLDVAHNGEIRAAFSF